MQPPISIACHYSPAAAFHSHYFGGNARPHRARFRWPSWSLGAGFAGPNGGHPISGARRRMICHHNRSQSNRRALRIPAVAIEGFDRVVVVAWFVCGRFVVRLCWDVTKGSEVRLKWRTLPDGDECNCSGGRRYNGRYSSERRLCNYNKSTVAGDSDDSDNDDRGRRHRHVCWY